MGQARLVLKDGHLDIANGIKDVTQLGSLSEVIGALLTRYGRHMAETWEVLPEQVTQPHVDPYAVTSVLPAFDGSPPTDTRLPEHKDDFL